MSIVHGDVSNFDDLIKDELVLVDFYATWCGPCKMLSPVLEDISSDRDNLKIVKIDVDQNNELAKSNSIMSVPTLILYKNGKMVSKMSGYMNKDELMTWIDENK